MTATYPPQPAIRDVDDPAARARAIRDVMCANPIRIWPFDGGWQAIHDEDFPALLAAKELNRLERLLGNAPPPDYRPDTRPAGVDADELTRMEWVAVGVFLLLVVLYGSGRAISAVRAWP